MLTELGFKFGIQGIDQGLKQMEQGGKSFGILGKGADEAAAHLKSAEEKMKGHFARMGQHARDYASKASAAMGRVRQSVLSGKGMMMGAGAAVVGGGILGAPFALAASRAPISKELSKYTAAGMSKEEIAGIEAKMGQLTSQVPYLKTQEGLAGALNLMRVFRGQTAAVKDELLETMAKGGRVTGLMGEAASDVIIKWNEAWGHDIADKAAGAKKFIAEIEEAHRKSPGLFKPEDVLPAMEFGPKLKKMGWNTSQFLASLSVMGDQSAEILSRITGMGPKKYAKMFAMTNKLWSDPEQIERLKAMQTPATAKQATFFEERNKQTIDLYKPMARKAVREGPVELFSLLGEAMEGIKKKFPDDFESKIEEETGIKRGAGMAKLYKAVEAAKSGNLAGIQEAIGSAQDSLITGTLAKMDEGIDAKLELIKQRFAKFTVAMAKVFEPIVGEVLGGIGGKLDEWSGLWSNNMAAIRDNAKAAIGGIKTGFSSIYSTDWQGLGKMIESGLAKPDIEGWKEWGKGIGEWLGQARQDLSAIADAVKSVTGAINSAAKSYQEIFGGASATTPGEQAATGGGILGWLKSKVHAGPNMPAWAANKLGLSPMLEPATSPPAPLLSRAMEERPVLNPAHVAGASGVGNPQITVQPNVNVQVEGRVELDGREVGRYVADHARSENARARRGAGDNAAGFAFP